MAKRGGFPGGGMPGNMANLMKQAQKMQRQMEEQAKELESKEFTATAGGTVHSCSARKASSATKRPMMTCRLPAVSWAQIWLLGKLCKGSILLTKTVRCAKL